jgi:hypothetical protein
MFPCWLLADGVARREPEQRATRWVGTYRTVSVSSPELVSSNLDQALTVAGLGGIARRGFGADGSWLGVDGGGKSL